MQTDRRPPPLNPPSNYKGIQADTVVKSPTDAQMEAEMDKVLSQTKFGLCVCIVVHVSVCTCVPWRVYTFSENIMDV